jgi:transcriptional adapter 3
MPSKLSAHQPPPHAPDFLYNVELDSTLLATDELELRLEALRKLKLKHLERSKHAAENLRASEDEIRRIREKEKGKSKAIEKIKRERDCAYFFWKYCQQCLLVLYILFLIRVASTRCIFRFLIYESYWHANGDI